MFICVEESITEEEYQEFVYQALLQYSSMGEAFLDLTLCLKEMNEEDGKIKPLRKLCMR